MSSAKPRVLIVDDIPEVRAALKGMLEELGIAVVGEAGDGASGVRAAEGLRPDIVLMDWRMPGMDGLEATRRVLALGLDVQVIIVSAFATSGFAELARAAGAAGLLAKGEHPTAIVAAIEQARRARHVEQPSP